MKEKKSFYEKVKEHKAEIIIACVTIAGGILIAKNWNLIKNLDVADLLKGGVKVKDDIVPLVPEVIQNVVIDFPSNKRVIDVSKHIRNLPKGWKASPEKITSAIKKGIALAENQTWVDEYSKLCA